MTVITRFLGVLFLLLCACSAFALGEEEFGNTPLHEANYREWPGILPAINQESRVYRSWVNGNEHFYYRGNTTALNAMLTAFADFKGDAGEIILRPGPGRTSSFHGEKVEFGWQLHLVGGIARHMTTLEQGDKIWRTHPVLTIYVSKDRDLKQLKLPDKMKVLSLDPVKQRTREALQSHDKTVRGWGAGELVSLDPYDPESQKAIIPLLKDEDNWVRLNAVSALSRFGRKAETTLLLLREMLKSEDLSLKQAAEKSLQAIEEAQEDVQAEREYRDMLKQIQRFLSRREADKSKA